MQQATREREDDEDSKENHHAKQSHKTQHIRAGARMMMAASKDPSSRRVAHHCSGRPMMKNETQNTHKAQATAAFNQCR